MPRTKRPVRKQEKISEDNDTLKKLNKLGTFCLLISSGGSKNKIDARAHMELRNVELAFKMLLGSISNNYMQKTVGQLKTELLLKEPPPSRRSTTRNSARSVSHDDGYLTENSSQGSGERSVKKNFLAPPSATRTASRRSRSADTSRYTNTATVSRTVKTQRRRSRSVYKTPAYNKNAPLNYPIITPKVTPHTPLTVLRQPRAGEMVLSMSGSPVMVPTICTLQQEEKANCNILLKDGTMLSLQPKELRQSQAYIPFSLMDTGVLDQLNTLKSNLEKVLQLRKDAKNFD